MTFSRAGFLTLGAIVLLSRDLLGQAARAGGRAAVIVVALIVDAAAAGGIFERLSTITDIEADRTGSAQGRWDDFRWPPTVVAANPIIGVGIGQDILALNEARGRDDLAVGAQRVSGIRGRSRAARLALFLWLLVASFRSARAVERRTAREPALRI